jgi:hypothetical protein
MVLNINPDIVCAIISRAKEFFAKEEVAFPNDPEDADQNDDWYFALFEDFKDDLTFTELQTSIADLEPDQQAALVALLWIGRGDFDAKEWDDAFNQAKESWNKRTADYLLSKPLLPSYLEEGLEQLGYHCDQ